MIPDYFKKKVKNNPKLYSVWVFYKYKIHIHFRIWNKVILKKIDRKTDEEKLMINIGGGEFFLRHWRILDFNTDYYRRGYGIIDYFHDLKSPGPFPFRDNQVYLFYSSHTLEHIPQKFCQHILDEIYRCLKPQGAVRLTMPGFDGLKKAYINKDQRFFQPYDNMPPEISLLHWVATYFAESEERLSPDEVKEKLKTMSIDEFVEDLTNKIPEDYQNNNYGHCNWWSYEKLEKMLRKAGFTKMYHSSAQGSKFKEMRVGDKFRSSFDTTCPHLSAFIEAIK